MNDPLLIARLAGQRIAFVAREIESIVELGAVTPVPKAPEHIEGLATLRSEALTVVDCTRMLGLPLDPHRQGTAQQAAVIKRDGHLFALKLDDVEDVVEPTGDIESVLGGVGEEWSRFARGMIDTGSGAALLLEVEPFIRTESETEPAVLN